MVLRLSAVVPAVQVVLAVQVATAVPRCKATVMHHISVIRMKRLEAAVKVAMVQAATAVVGAQVVLPVL